MLVIEDDPSLCRLIELILKRDGLTAAVVQRGDDGAAAIARNGNQYDAIILDVMLPGMDGVELLDRVKKDSPDLLGRILVISAASAGLLEKIRVSTPVRAVIRKPFDLDTVRMALRDCVRERVVSDH